MIHGSVLYHIQSRAAPNLIVIGGAQQQALKLNLPFAVVAVVSKELLMAEGLQLADLESKLTRFNIPLIVLIGDESTVLKGLFHHVKPMHVYSDAVPPPTQQALVKHSQQWPGTIIKVAELKRLIEDSSTATCL